MHLIVATTSYSTLSNIATAHQQLSVEQREQFSISLFNIEHALSEGEWERFAQAAQTADFFLYDPHGAEEATIDQMAERCSTYGMNQVSFMLNGSHLQKYVKLGPLRGWEIMNDYQTQKLTLCEPAGVHLSAAQIAEKKRALSHYEEIVAYWKASGIFNWQQLIYFLGRTYGNIDFPAPAKPTEYEGLGIIDPDSKRFYDSVEAYADDTHFEANKPVVAVFYLAYNSRVATSGVVAEIARKIRPIANVLPIGFTSTMQVDTKRLQELLQQPGYRVNLIVNFLGFRLGMGPRGHGKQSAVNILEQLDVPVLHPFFLSRVEKEDWEQASGLPPSDFLVHVVLPELDGNIETYPVAAIQPKGFDPNYQIGFKELELIEERVDLLIARIEKWLSLQQKKNAEKRIALIGYDYPPGEGNVFGGSFLDTFASVSRLLTELKQAGYQVDAYSADQLRDQLIQGQLVNSGKWIDDLSTTNLIRYDSTDYIRELAMKSWRKEVVSQWGTEPGTVMTEGEQFLIPGFISGNVFIGLQPTRGIHEQPEKVYHDHQLPPPHQYAAFYKWVREQFAADAIIHVGTHGTLEFLPGKETGMSADCFPDQFIGDVPHLYYYYVGNASEGMIAKRRSHATLISYQAPPFAEGGLYGDYDHLNKLLHEYREAKQLDPERCPHIWAQMQAIASQLKLNSTKLDDVEAELYRLNRSLIPHGLHVLGQGFSKEDAVKHMIFVLRHDRAEAQSLRRLFAYVEGWDYDRLLADHDTEQLAKLDDLAARAVELYVESGKIPDVNSDLRGLFEQTLSFGKRACEATLHNEEMDTLLHGLNGKYIPAKLAGDVIRSPEILPTGKNMYQLDPREVPSPSAIERGAEIAKRTVELYRSQTGNYPETTAVVMWGMETARTRGETIGQILYYLGARLAPKPSDFRRVYDIIPMNQLQRPRLNVVVNISGIFRDMFPNVIEDLHELFKRIALLDEPEEDNYFKGQTNRLYTKLRDEGYSQEKARDLACARIFGPPEGEYGTGVSKLIETKNWSDEAQLGEMYKRHTRYVYSSNYHGQEMEQLLDAHLEAVDIVSQLRSNHEYELIDLDDYYSFFGGFSKSIEVVKGKKPEVYITDTTSETILTEEAGQSINRGVRTRLLNPKWIDALLEHPHHGAQKIAQRFENILGIAATTNQVENWVFSALHETYVADEERSKQMEANNRFAYHEMIETLLECHQRQYWEATDDQLEQLQQKYMELESHIEE
ncbi:cobaltochelatase CobN [Kroppenstedtia sanguinis]|uniref:magnesium chelatase subunit H n=1 Tax=Kroppenstedtia sanguinis TaxID=1380684 RepID=UPI003D24FB4B